MYVYKHYWFIITLSLLIFFRIIFLLFESHNIKCIEKAKNAFLSVSIKTVYCIMITYMLKCSWTITNIIY